MAAERERGCLSFLQGNFSSFVFGGERGGKEEEEEVRGQCRSTMDWFFGRFLFFYRSLCFFITLL